MCIRVVVVEGDRKLVRQVLYPETVEATSRLGAPCVPRHWIHRRREDGQDHLVCDIQPPGCARACFDVRFVGAKDTWESLDSLHQQALWAYRKGESNGLSSSKDDPEQAQDLERLHQLLHADIVVFEDVARREFGKFVNPWALARLHALMPAALHEELLNSDTRQILLDNGQYLLEWAREKLWDPRPPERTGHATEDGQTDLSNCMVPVPEVLWVDDLCAWTTHLHEAYELAAPSNVGPLHHHLATHLADTVGSFTELATTQRALDEGLRLRRRARFAGQGERPLAWPEVEEALALSLVCGTTQGEAHGLLRQCECGAADRSAPTAGGGEAHGPPLRGEERPVDDICNWVRTLRDRRGASPGGHALPAPHLLDAPWNLVDPDEPIATVPWGRQVVFWLLVLARAAAAKRAGHRARGELCSAVKPPDPLPLQEQRFSQVRERCEHVRVYFGGEAIAAHRRDLVRHWYHVYHAYWKLTPPQVFLRFVRGEGAEPLDKPEDDRRAAALLRDWAHRIQAAVGGRVRDHGVPTSLVQPSWLPSVGAVLLEAAHAWAVMSQGPDGIRLAIVDNKMPDEYKTEAALIALRELSGWGVFATPSCAWERSLRVGPSGHAARRALERVRAVLNRAGVPYGQGASALRGFAHRDLPPLSHAVAVPAATHGERECRPKVVPWTPILLMWHAPGIAVDECRGDDFPSSPGETRVHAQELLGLRGMRDWQGGCAFLLDFELESRQDGDDRLYLGDDFLGELLHLQRRALLGAEPVESDMPLRWIVERPIAGMLLSKHTGNAFAYYDSGRLDLHMGELRLVGGENALHFARMAPLFIKLTALIGAHARRRVWEVAEYFTRARAHAHCARADAAEHGRAGGERPPSPAARRRVALNWLAILSPLMTALGKLVNRTVGRAEEPSGQVSPELVPYDPAALDLAPLLFPPQTEGEATAGAPQSGRSDVAAQHTSHNPPASARIDKVAEEALAWVESLALLTARLAQPDVDRLTIHAELTDLERRARNHGYGLRDLLKAFLFDIERVWGV